jgi:hypothetical protein
MGIVSITSVLVLGGLIQQVSAQKAPVVLPIGTIVAVKIDETVSGKTHMIGSTVKASVARDVTVNNIVAIKIGTPVDVVVAQSEKAGMVGQAGAINLNFESTTTVDGQNVFLRGNAGAEGQSATGTAVGAGVVLCPLFLMVKGKEGFIPAGTEMLAKTLSVVSVQVPD